VTGAIMQMTKSQTTVFNRTEMHSGIRGATELLQQEVGQAGLISLPISNLKTTSAVTPELPYTNTAAGCSPTDVTLSAVNGMWADSVGRKDGIKLTFLGTNAGAGVYPETVRVTNIAGNTITACFRHKHLVGNPVMALGGFAEGIIPQASGHAPDWVPYPNGSEPNRLKLFGDINGDGGLVYVEYYCDNGDPGTDGSHNLYRKVTKYGDAKTPLTDSDILLSNVWPNPPDTNGVERPCFEYQEVTIKNTLNDDDSHPYVLDVAITLTVQTQQKDPVTRQFQKETKALLNVSPRNVFNTWMLAGNSIWDRIQPTPQKIKTLLPQLVG
jgi:hypothetical protein